MKVFLMVLGVVLMAGAAWAMGDIYVSGTWRFKITVEVETPEGLKSGSAVYEMSNADSSAKILNFPEAGNPATLKGEAVVVDLGKRGVLFSLIPGERTFYNAFPRPGGPGGETTTEGIRYYKNLKDAKAILKPEQYPMMVIFKDLKDPMSVQRVNTTNLFPQFGEGMSLQDVTIEITDEPITLGIEGKLPWLSGLNGGYLHGGFTGKDAPLGLHTGNFKQGAK